MVSATQQLVFGNAAPKRKPPGRLPIFKTMAYTLMLSCDFLWKDFVGECTLDETDVMLDRYARRIFRSGNATLKVTGRENLEPGKAYIVMSNHRSLLDIPVIFAAVPGHVRMVLKEELTRVPVWGQALKASGFIPVDRKNTSKAIEQLNVAKEQVSRGVNVWISPEGTRARDGKLADFKKGGFHLAKQLEVPIIPVWLEGTDTIIPPDQFIACYDGEAEARLGKPIDTAEFELPDLMNKVREEMLALGDAPRRATKP
jgi:1-acyl-sn-glycerol-3-phosphate acyltransferase